VGSNRSEQIRSSAALGDPGPGIRRDERNSAVRDKLPDRSYTNTSDFGGSTLPSSARRVGAGLIVLVCLTVAAIEGYDIQAFGIAAPKLVPEFGLNPAQQGWAASIAMIGLVVGAFAGGSLADRVGRKPVLLGAIAMFGVFSLATAASHSFPVLLAARFLTGLGCGAGMPNLLAVAVEISRPERRAFTVTAMFCGFPMGGMSSALVARLAGPTLDWRTIFIVGGALPLVLLPLVFLLLPETRPEREPAADRNLLRALFGAGHAAATALLWTTCLLTAVILYLVLNWLPTLVVALGRPPSEGFAAAVAFNGAGLGAMALGALADRIGWRWPLTLAYAGLAAALAALAMGASQIVLFSAIAGLGVLGAQFVMYGVIPQFYPPHMRAAAAGSALAFGRVGSIVGPLLAGELRNAGATPGQVFLATVPVAILAGLAMLTLAVQAGRMGVTSATGPALDPA